MSKLDIFQDPCFLESLFITDFSPSFIDNYIDLIIPSVYKSHNCINWLRIDTEINTINANSTPPPTELLIYNLWNEKLFKESLLTLAKLKSYPLVPVISRSRRLLISVEYLNLVFCVNSTGEQDNRRFILIKII